MCPKDAVGIASRADPNQTSPLSSLIWVFSACSDIPIQILIIFMVAFSGNNSELLISSFFLGDKSFDILKIIICD